MSAIAGDRVGPMLNPPHLGELIRESMDDAGWNITETAARLGCERGTLSRLLNGKAGVSATMALALEELGWGTARPLDADAGQLRACAGTSAAERGRLQRRPVALMTAPVRGSTRHGPRAANGAKIEGTQMASTNDPHEVLGLHPSASRDETRKRYRELARRYHPDVNGGDPTATWVFKQINKAQAKISGPA